MTLGTIEVKPFLVLLGALLFMLSSVEAHIINKEVVLNLTITNQSVTINSASQVYTFQNAPLDGREFKINTQLNISQLNITNVTVILQNITTTMIINNTNPCEPMNLTTLQFTIDDSLGRYSRKNLDEYINILSSSIVAPRKLLDELTENMTICEGKLGAKEAAINLSAMQMLMLSNSTNQEKEFLSRTISTKDNEVQNYKYLILILIIGIIALFGILLFPILSESLGIGGRL